jgi:Spy/CpxP family protein refolding chaperone
MHKTLLTLIGLGATAVLSASAATAQQPFGPGEGGHGPGGLRGPARILDLTEEQQAAARAIFEQGRPRMEALHEQMRENREALRDALESDPPDPFVVGELVIEGHSLQEQGRAVREESKEAFARILNAEQKSKLETLEAARALTAPKGRRGMRGPHGGDWGPPGPPDGEDGPGE